MGYHTLFSVGGESVVFGGRVPGVGVGVGVSIYNDPSFLLKSHKGFFTRSENAV